MKKLLAKPTTRAGVTDTCQITGFEGKGSAPNVIPSRAAAIMDCRLLPGTTPRAMQEELEALVKDVPGIKFEVLQSRAYGFVPFDITPEELATFHGRDERVSVKNVHRGLEILYRAVVDVAAVP